MHQLNGSLNVLTHVLQKNDCCYNLQLIHHHYQVKYFLVSFNGFFGTIKLSVFVLSASVRLYLTSLCASVETNCNAPFESSKKTPVIAGLKSSLLTANKVLFMPFNNAAAA